MGISEVHTQIDPFERARCSWRTCASTRASSESGYESEYRIQVSAIILYALRCTDPSTGSHSLPSIIYPARDGVELWPGQSPIENAVQPLQYPSFNTVQMSQASSLVPAPSNTDLSPGVEARELGQRDLDGRTALHRAVIRGSMEDVEYLLSLGLSFNDYDNDGNQPLHHAASKGFAGIIQLLLQKGAHVNASGPGGKTPVHLALRSLDSVHILLGANPTLSLQDNDGNTALHTIFMIATFLDPPLPHVMDSLLDAGADPTIPNDTGITPFHMAIDPPDPAAMPYLCYVEVFLKRIINLAMLPGCGEGLLEIFLDRTKSDRGLQSTINVVNSICKVMIEKGASPNIQLKSGEYLPHAALRSPEEYQWDFELLRILCEKADVDVIATNGDTLLHSAIRGSQSWSSINTYKYINCIEILLDRGAERDIQNEAGDSPLMTALKAKHDEVHITAEVNTLLHGGADPMQTDKAGDLPIYVAFRSYDGERGQTLIQLLVDSFEVWYLDMRESDERSWHSDMRNRDERSWWRDYYHLLYSKPPPHFLLQSLADTSGLPSDIEIPLSKLLLAIAAEKILHELKTEFITDRRSMGLKHQDTITSRDGIVRILRECLALDLNIDQSWYRYLLELFP